MRLHDNLETSRSTGVSHLRQNFTCVKGSVPMITSLRRQWASFLGKEENGELCRSLMRQRRESSQCKSLSCLPPSFLHILLLLISLADKNEPLDMQMGNRWTCKSPQVAIGSAALMSQRTFQQVSHPAGY